MARPCETESKIGKSISILPDLWRRVEEAAKELDRSPSWWIAAACEEKLERDAADTK